jgi:hypothetical protein
MVKKSYHTPRFKGLCDLKQPPHLVTPIFKLHTLTCENSFTCLEGKRLTLNVRTRLEWSGKGLFLGVLEIVTMAKEQVCILIDL